MNQIKDISWKIEEGAKLLDRCSDLHASCAGVQLKFYFAASDMCMNLVV